MIQGSLHLARQQSESECNWRSCASGQKRSCQRRDWYSPLVKARRGQGIWAQSTHWSFFGLLCLQPIRSSASTPLLRDCTSKNEWELRSLAAFTNHVNCSHFPRTGCLSILLLCIPVWSLGEELPTHIEGK